MESKQRWAWTTRPGRLDPDAGWDTMTAAIKFTCPVDAFRSPLGGPAGG
jgi:hypothetical protein